MEFINKILKRDASYASNNMVAGMSVSTSTTKLVMKANITKSRGIREHATYPRNDKSASPQQSDFKQPRTEDDSPQEVHPAKKQTSKVVGGTVHLSLVPFDVKNAPLTFTQMEQIHATIIDMMIEHDSPEINAESLNCQFKTGCMAFKCSTATAEWLKLNCNDISAKCKVNLNVVEDINQDKKQNQSKSTRNPRLKRNYYLALHHLRELKKAKENGVPVTNALLIRTKYESMIEDYLETQKNERRLRKLLVLDGVLERPKKARPHYKRYRMALNCLDKLKKLEESGTPLDEKKLMSRRRLQSVVDEFLREQAEDKKPIGRIFNSFRPFHEVITDPLCVAVGGKRKGLFVPICKEWPAIALQIYELVDSYVLENQDEGIVPHYDMSEVHRNFRVIKCKDEFSKKFLYKCINTIKDKFAELNLMIIPASQIPKTRRNPIDLKGEAALKKYNQTISFGSSKSVKSIPSASVSTSAENMDFQTPLKYNETKKIATLQDHLMVEADNQHFQTSNPFRSKDFRTIQHHDFTEKTIISNIHCIDKTENTPRDFPTKSYLPQQPQYSRNTAEVSFENRFNPLRSSDFTTDSHAVRTKIPENFTEKSSFEEESWETKNYLNTSVESEFSDRFRASNETLRRSSERSDDQSHMLMNSREWRRSPDFYANSGSNRPHFYQDSFPDCSNPYRIDELSASSKRSSERNPVQSHKLANSESRWRSSDFYENLNTPPGYNRSPYRNDRELSPNAISMRSRKRSPALMDSKKRRFSPDFHAKLTDPYEDSSPHYSNPYRNSSPSDSFNNRYHKPDSFDILSTEASKHNIRGKETYRSDEFYDVSGHRGFESFPNNFSQTDSRNNNSYSRRERSYFPIDDDDIPPPPPRWN